MERNEKPHTWKVVYMENGLEGNNSKKPGVPMY